MLTRLAVILALVSSGIVACGTSDLSTPAATEGSQPRLTVEDLSDLPNCTADNRGQVATVRDAPDNEGLYACEEIRKGYCSPLDPGHCVGARSAFDWKQAK